MTVLRGGDSATPLALLRISRIVENAQSATLEQLKAAVASRRLTRSLGTGYPTHQELAQNC